MKKFRDDCSFAVTLKRVHALVKKVDKSSKATEMLLSESHMSSCPTRWSSSYLMVKRLLTKVLKTLEWDNLATSKWKALESVKKLLKPFAQYTSLVGEENYSSVIPIVVEVNLHLEEMKKIPEVTNVSALLQSELKRRFRKYTNPNDPDHEPLFIMTTMLDPQYRVLLNPTQAESTKKQV